VSDLAARVRGRLVSAAAGRVDRATVMALVREEGPLLAPSAADAIVAEVLAAVAGLGPLEPFLADPTVTDVLVNGDGAVWIERAGELVRTPARVDPGEVHQLIERVVAPLGLRVDRASPLVDARLPDGSRVHAVVPPLAVDGPCLTIRRFAARALPVRAFTTGRDVVALLAAAVAARANVVVSGGTGTGKTTLLNSLARHIPSGERIITVEDAAELRLDQPHVVRLEARPANAEGFGQVTVRELVRNALRMRPDRIVVGECRGGEALDMLQAMNTGHEGSLTTCHANSAEDALRRLETMVLLADIGLPLAAVRDQLQSAVDLVVQVARGAGGRRRIDTVAEVLRHPDGPDAPRTRVLAEEGRVVAAPTRLRLAGASG
jgi:pilus assembly protein CpaF